MIHPHDETKDNQLGMTFLAEIHSLSCSKPQALGTTAQKSHTVAWLQAFPIASVGNLMSSELQLPSELVPKFLKARNSAVASLLAGWGFMAFPASRMGATSPDTSTPF